MNGVGEAASSLRNVTFMGIRVSKVWLMERCRMADDHVLFVSRNPDGHWRLSLVSKKPEPAIIRKLVTDGEEQAIRIAGLITAVADPADFYDIIERAKPNGSSMVPAELCERIHRAMRVEASAA